MGFISLLVFAAIVILIGYLISRISGLGDWNQNYYRLRKQFGGERSLGGVMYGYYFATPTLMFLYGSIHCKLKSRRKFFLVGPRQTEFRMFWQGEPLSFTLKATPNPTVSKFKSIPLNTPKAFGQVYTLTSAQPQLVRKFLGVGIQSELEQLRCLNQDGALQITLNGQSLKVTKPGYIRDFPSLDHLIRHSINLYQQLTLGEDQAIVFLQHDKTVVLERIQCSLCKANIEGPMVLCRGCKTPHCKECWTYSQRCSTYACRETRYEETPKARPVGK